MVSGFRQKKINSVERVGEILRTEREQKGKSLSEIAVRIKVREEHLHNLEEGYYDNLPADVYTKGFLKTYAEYLGLNAEKLIRMYNRESGIKDHLDRNEGKTEAEPEKIKASLLTPRLLKIIAIVVVVAAAVSYLVWQFSNFSRDPVLAIAEPANDITVAEDKVIFNGTAERESELTINGQGVFVNEDGSFSEEIALQEGLNRIVVVVRDRQGRETSLTRQILREELPVEKDEENNGDNDNEAEDLEDETSDAAILKLEDKKT